jgi:hypothetical protein
MMPPKATDDIEDLPSSEQAEDMDADQITDLADDANSSSAADETPKDTLSVVRDVVAASQEEKPTEPGSSPEGEDATVETAGKAADDENYTDVPFHKHPRFQQLLRDKKAADVDAVRYRNVESFLERSNLDAAEAADGLEIMGLAKTDPVAAWERMKPFVEKVAIAAGVIMPPDLQQKVQQGHMSREAAIEVSTARAQVQSAQTRQQLQQQQAERRAQMEGQQAIVGAALSWEADRKTKDPNFDAKLPALQREIAYLHSTEGRPNTPQGVTEQCERAYKAVNAAFRPPVTAPTPQRKPAVRPVTGGQVAGNPAAEANSTLDIIRAHRRSG